MTQATGTVMLTIAQAAQPSPSGTTLTGTTGTIVDSFGNVWALSTATSQGQGLQITINGTVDPPTNNVILMEVLNGTIYQENASKNWYACTPTAAISGGNASWTQVAAPPSNTITMTSTQAAAVKTALSTVQADLTKLQNDLAALTTALKPVTG